MAPLGLKLSFLSSFTGIVDFMHMDPEKSMNYSPDQVVRRLKDGWSWYVAYNIFYLLQRFRGIISEILLMIAVFLIFYLNYCHGCFRAVKSKAVPGVMEDLFEKHERLASDRKMTCAVMFPSLHWYQTSL